MDWKKHWMSLKGKGGAEWEGHMPIIFSAGFVLAALMASYQMQSPPLHYQIMGLIEFVGIMVMAVIMARYWRILDKKVDLRT